MTSPSTTFRLGEVFFSFLGLRKKNKEIALSEVKRILVVRVDEIGDVVMSIPFLRELRGLTPQAKITLVVKPVVFNLVEHCPYVDEILTYDWQIRYPKTRNLQLHWRALKLFWNYYWHDPFDLAILPRWDADRHYGNFVSYFSGAPWRVGYSENVTPAKKKLNRTLDLLMTHPLQDDSVKHEVEHNLGVLRFLGGKNVSDKTELWLDQEDEKFADQFFISHGINKGNIVVTLAPGTWHRRKQWPIQRFEELGQWICDKYGAKIIVIGAKGEELLGDHLEKNVRGCVINAIAKTTLRQTSAILKRSQLFIGNDTGPMHLASALNIPIVAMFCHPQNGKNDSSNSPFRFGPWKSPGVIVQPTNASAPCVNECDANEPHCILGVSVEQVKDVMIQKRIFVEGQQTAYSSF